MQLIRSRFARPVMLLAAVSLFGAACNDTSGPDYITGTVTVTVTDTNNAPVSLVELELQLPDKATI